MKNIITVFILLCITNAYSQFGGGNNDGHALETIQFDFSTVSETYVPDDNFELALIALGLDSGPVDDYVLTSNIINLVSLNVNSQNISDLTGIEDFIALTQLRCQNNNLTSLDISNNNALTLLMCNNNNLTSLDISNNVDLISVSVSQNNLTNLNISNNSNLENLFLSENNLTTLDISNNIALTNLYVQNNNLSNLNIDNNINLTEINVSFNDLVLLDPRNNIALEQLICTNNDIGFLELSNNIALNYLDCNTNELSGLRIKNGNNTNVTVFITTSNPNLTCIDVDDVLYSNANWTNIDATSYFSLDCNIAQTYVPDDNFENYLETHDASGNVVVFGDPASMGNGIANDNYVVTTNISSVIELNVNNENIADLTGIEDFTALTVLIAFDNDLTTLDVSNNTSLNLLSCNENQLTNLDISQNTALTNLNCFDNNLTSLDTSQNALLENLFCSQNQITNLDLSQNTALTELYCYSNSLTSLNLDQNTALTTLNCHNNSITSLGLNLNLALESLICYNNQISDLDLSNNLVFNSLSCYNNQLTDLNVKNGNNTNFINFGAANNPSLTCIQVDDEAFSTATWISIDPASSFSEFCGDNSVLIAPKIFLQGPYNSGSLSDDLRSTGNIPTTSPYADGLTCNASVFTPTGSDAIIDWVWIEIRDTDGTTVVDSTSALIQSDGDIVSEDGTSSVVVDVPDGSYHIMISHRNHLGVLTANTYSLTKGSTAAIDLTSNSALINGGVLGISDMGDGNFALFSGDFNGNGQVQNSDRSGVLPLRGLSGYSDADINMNSEVQNSDVQVQLNPNIGKGEQFSGRTLDLKLYAKRRVNN